jgi:hypothetical protein
VLIGLPLNFANIIALPLLLGVGVAFKIYYVMAWRAGKTGLLQSTLTRASDIQRHDNCDRVRKHVVVELSRHFDHGRADGPVAVVHDGGLGVLPARSDGSAAASEGIFRTGRKFTPSPGISVKADLGFTMSAGRSRARGISPPKLSKEQPCVLMIMFKQSGANVIETADLVQAALPRKPFVAVTAVKASSLSRVVWRHCALLSFAPRARSWLCRSQERHEAPPQPLPPRRSRRPPA